MIIFISFKFKDLNRIFHDMKANFSEWKQPGWRPHMTFHLDEPLFTMWNQGAAAYRHA